MLWLVPTDPWCNMLQILLGRNKYEEVNVRWTPSISFFSHPVFKKIVNYQMICFSYQKGKIFSGSKVIPFCGKFKGLKLMTCLTPLLFFVLKIWICLKQKCGKKYSLVKKKKLKNPPRFMIYQYLTNASQSVFFTNLMSLSNSTHLNYRMDTKFVRAGLYLCKFPNLMHFRIMSSNVKKWMSLQRNSLLKRLKELSNNTQALTKNINMNI